MARLAEEDFIRVLAEPPRIQEQLWREAFDQFIGDLHGSEEGRFHILSFHACYYHQLKTELGCPVALDKLLRLKDRVKMVITLIDDCYDIYLRLMDDHQMYASVRDPNKTTRDGAVFQSMINLIRIMTWREAEIAFSRKIAGLLEVPFFVIAVKHPRSIVSNLIERRVEDLKILYLSHHISEIRTGPSSSRGSSFPSELFSFLQRMSNDKNTLLFVPDTIDELRIEKDATGAFVPKLQSGWPLPYEGDWLFEPLPEGICRINPLNPQGFDYESAPKALKSAISSVLSALDSTIREQVNSRDRTIVEQTPDGIVVYRPYWVRRMSPGIEEELEYNLQLKNASGEQYRRAYVLNTFEDVGKMLISKLFVILKSSVDEDTDSKTVHRLDQLCTAMLADRRMVLAFAESQCDKKKIREDIETELGDLKWNLIPNRVPVGRRSMEVAPRFGETQALDRTWDSAFEQISEDPLVKYCDEKSSFICWDSEFNDKLGGFLPEICSIKRDD